MDHLKDLNHLTNQARPRSKLVYSVLIYPQKSFILPVRDVSDLPLKASFLSSSSIVVLSLIISPSVIFSTSFLKFDSNMKMD